METRDLKFDRLPETLKRVGLKRSMFYLLIARGDAPRPVKLGDRTSAWERGEIDSWMRARMAARNSPAVASK